MASFDYLGKIKSEASILRNYTNTLSNNTVTGARCFYLSALNDSFLFYFVCNLVYDGISSSLAALFDVKLTTLILLDNCFYFDFGASKILFSWIDLPLLSRLSFILSYFCNNLLLDPFESSANLIFIVNGALSVIGSSISPEVLR